MAKKSSKNSMRTWTIQVPTWKTNKKDMEKLAAKYGYANLTSYLRHLIEVGLETDSGKAWRL